MTTHEELQKIGASAYASIEEMVDRLELDWERMETLRQGREEAPGLTTQDWQELHDLEALADGCESDEDALERIYEDPLEIAIRSDWCSSGDYPGPPAGFKILLTTGGPAVRIIGGLDEFGDPVRARLEVQDWFTTWTEYPHADESVLLRYAECFAFEALS